LSSPVHNIHVIPLGLDYDRIVRGLEAYGAGAIYVIRGEPHPIEDAVEPYLDKLKKRYAKLADAGRFFEIRIDIFNIGEVCRAIYKIIDSQNSANSRLHFCISSSTKLLSAYLLFAVWSKAEDLEQKPVIYYVDPKRYLHIEFAEIAKSASNLLQKHQSYLNKERTGEIAKFLKRIRDLGRDATEGLALGEADKVSRYEIPFIPVKRPEKTGIDILRILNLEPEAASQKIDSLTRLYLRNVRGVKSSYIDDKMVNKTRSMLFHHIRRLEELGLIKTERVGRKVRVNMTELGSIFAEAFSR